MERPKKKKITMFQNDYELDIYKNGYNHACNDWKKYLREINWFKFLKAKFNWEHLFTKKVAFEVAEAVRKRLKK